MPPKFAKAAGLKGFGGAGFGANKAKGMTALMKQNMNAAKNQPEEVHGILEGISSLHSWIKTQTMIRPHPKMQRGKAGYEEDQDEDVVITLTAKNPQAPQNIVRFDHTTGEFIHIKLSETMIDQLEIESTVLHKDSAEAKKQIEEGGGAQNQKSQGFKAMAQKELLNRRLKTLLDFDDKDGLDGDSDEDEDEILEQKKEQKKKKKKKGDKRGGDDDDDDEDGKKNLQNQFSFVERATQTMNNSMKNDEVQTEPPPRASFSDTVNQWIIYDAYTNYERLKELQEEQEKTKGKTLGKADDPAGSFNIKKILSGKTVDPNEELNKKLLKAAKILERMVNQNTFNDIALDFKYWEDASDEFREKEGTLLPLWKFNFEGAKNLEVTSLCWNPSFSDLFAVAYGTYNFYEQDLVRDSYVSVFSLKNPSFPEYLCHAHCGVMCVDIHPNHPHMLAAGLSDGSVAVYNLQVHSNEPSYLSNANNGKHQDIVWQIKWAKDNLDGYLNFYSVSGDGRVTNWTIVKTNLWNTDIMNINFSKVLENFPEQSLRDNLKEGGRSVTFNPKDPTMFLVGTEEGLIYKCTTEYSSKYLETYHAHNTPIYNIAWNPYVPSIFLTCGAEWMIKIWDHQSTKPLFMFDLNAQVGDIAWAPYSSTVFAVVTIDGKVHVFDLHLDKYHPICSQPIIPKKKAKLNHIEFNEQHPIIIVGDSKGTVHCLKLSPNLRKQTKEVRAAMVNREPKKALELEIKKLESLLAMVREPTETKKEKEDEQP